MVNSTLSVDGRITANGQNAEKNEGAGAGGAI